MSDNDFDYAEGDEDLREPSPTDSAEELEEEVDKVDEDYDSEDVYMDDTDPNDDEDDNEDDLEEEEEVDEVEEEEVADSEEEQIRRDVLEVVGEDTILRVKGREFRAGDLTANELVKHLQKGIRSDQLFQDAAQERAELAQEKERIQRDSRMLESISPKPTRQQTNLPKELQPMEGDSTEVRVLKETISNLSNQMSTLETSSKETASRQFEDQLLGQLDSLQKDYPCASIDEAVAVKVMRPNMDLEEIMEISHNSYRQGDHIERALEANPEFKREYDENVIAQYNLNRNKANRIEGTRRRAASGSQRISSQKRVIPKDFDEAAEMSRTYLGEVERLERE